MSADKKTRLVNSIIQTIARNAQYNPHEGWEPCENVLNAWKNVIESGDAYKPQLKAALNDWIESLVDESDFVQTLDEFRETRNTLSPEMAAEELNADVRSFEGIDEVLVYYFEDRVPLYINRDSTGYWTIIENTQPYGKLVDLEADLYRWAVQSC